MAGLVGRMVRAVGVIREPDLYQMVLRVYLPILFPLAFLITLAALEIDALLGLSPLLPEPLNRVLAALSLVAGAVVWILSYSTLVQDGDGSPAPVVRRTQRLVTSGIYAYCRNPSVHGKLLGFLSIGLFVNSTAFCLIVTPAILTVSLIEKVVRQEPQLIDFFGDEYLAYRDSVPLFLPFPGLYRWLKRGRGEAHAQAGPT